MSRGRLAAAHVCLAFNEAEVTLLQELVDGVGIDFARSNAVISGVLV